MLPSARFNAYYGVVTHTKAWLLRCSHRAYCVDCTSNVWYFQYRKCCPKLLAPNVSFANTVLVDLAFDANILLLRIRIRTHHTAIHTHERDFRFESVDASIRTV